MDTRTPPTQSIEEVAARGRTHPEAITRDDLSLVHEFFERYGMRPWADEAYDALSDRTSREAFTRRGALSLGRAIDFIAAHDRRVTNPAERSRVAYEWAARSLWVQEHPELAAEVGASLHRSGADGAAIPCLRIGTRSDSAPDRINSWTYLTDAHIALGQTSAAHEAYDHAVSAQGNTFVYLAWQRDRRERIAALDGGQHAIG